VTDVLDLQTMSPEHDLDHPSAEHDSQVSLLLCDPS
jgi:hypothetical protein